jgi:hypothetical protein
VFTAWYTLSLYVKHTFVCKCECRLNDMIVMYIVILALPVTLRSSSVCGTVFKFILQPFCIHLVGSLAVNGHQNVSEIFSCHRSICVWSDFKTILFSCSFFPFPLLNPCQTHDSRKYDNRRKVYGEEYKLRSFSLCNLHHLFPVSGKIILSREIMWGVETKTGVVCWTFL